MDVTTQTGCGVTAQNECDEIHLCPLEVGCDSLQIRETNPKMPFADMNRVQICFFRGFRDSKGRRW